MHFLLGLVLGVVIGVVVKWAHIYTQRTIGTILVKHEEEKTVYSLEIDEDPEIIQYKKRVTFKVDRGSNSDYNED